AAAAPPITAGWMARCPSCGHGRRKPAWARSSTRSRVRAWMRRRSASLSTARCSASRISAASDTNAASGSAAMGSTAVAASVAAPSLSSTTSRRWARSMRVGSNSGMVAASPGGVVTLGGQRRAEAAAQRGHGAKGEQLHGALAAAHDGGDLLVAQVAAEAQQDGLALVDRQLVDGGADVRVAVEPGHLLLGAGAVVGEVRRELDPPRPPPVA